MFEYFWKGAVTITSVKDGCLCLPRQALSFHVINMMDACLGAYKNFFLGAITTIQKIVLVIGSWEWDTDRRREDRNKVTHLLKILVSTVLSRNLYLATSGLSYSLQIALWYGRTIMASFASRMVKVLAVLQILQLMAFHLTNNPVYVY